eukprot:1161993-Pelagomonas_calceolata.AAC.5
MFFAGANNEAKEKVQMRRIELDKYRIRSKRAQGPLHDSFPTQLTIQVHAMACNCMGSTGSAPVF